MKRYLLFNFHVGYESYSGPKGWETFDGDFNTIQEAMDYFVAKFGTPKPDDEFCYQIVDTKTKAIVDSNV